MLLPLLPRLLQSLNYLIRYKRYVTSKINYERTFPTHLRSALCKMKIRELHAKFQQQEEHLTDTINKFMHNTAKDMENTKNEMIRDATSKVADYAAKQFG